MKAFISIALFCVICVTVQGKVSSPKVQVYTHFPGEYGKENTLICHVSGFHPPDINIDLLKDGEVIPNAQQTDLAFEKGWQFHITRSVSFTPKKGEQYTCKVRHMDKTNSYQWEPNM
ncbi:beta-2-microglobulin [Paramisgurnus dabryanus]|uniref:beta-2-microglobulin n=1 Tax=Paramisgurnus dabryanus TaxID=90735 RepID=UPI0031F34E45